MANDVTHENLKMKEETNTKFYVVYEERTNGEVVVHTTFSSYITEVTNDKDEQKNERTFGGNPDDATLSILEVKHRNEFEEFDNNLDHAMESLQIFAVK